MDYLVQNMLPLRQQLYHVICPLNLKIKKSISYSAGSIFINNSMIIFFNNFILLQMYKLIYKRRWN